MFGVRDFIQVPLALISISQYQALDPFYDMEQSPFDQLIHFDKLGAIPLLLRTGIRASLNAVSSGLPSLASASPFP